MTVTSISTVIFDSGDPAALAEFYAKATGWQVADSGDDWASVEGGPVGLAFQRVDGYQGPGWPNAGKHVHLDLKVDDLASAEKELVALGATRPEFQPGNGGWVVLLDPEGHPFCIAA